MKKILLIHNKYQLIGGEDIAVENEAKFLKKNFNVKELYFDNKINNLISQLFYFLLNQNFSSIKKIKKEIIDFDPDVIYIHNTWFKISPGVFKHLLKLNKPVLLKLHNYRFFCTRSYFSKSHFAKSNFCKSCGSKKNDVGIFNKYYHESFLKSLLVIKYGKKYFEILKHPDLKILALTNFQKNFLIDLGINKEKIFVHRNNLNTKNRQGKYFESHPYIVYAGRISNEKGVEIILEAYLNSKINKKFRLKIIGDGPDFLRLNKKYDKYNIDFLGQVNNLETLKIISRSKAVVTATLLQEGQPTLLCEASLLGIPSIFPQNESICEFFPKDYPLIFESNNKKDLENKFNKLESNLDFEKIGLENKEYMKKILEPKQYLLNFNQIINS